MCLQIMYLNKYIKSGYGMKYPTMNDMSED